MVRRWLPENVTAYRDRHGKQRYRFRKKGAPTHHFQAEPGTPEFLAELTEARAAKLSDEPRSAPFTYDALIASFYRTPKWLAMKPSSQRTYRSIIERFRAGNGHVDVRRVDTAAIDKKLSAMSATPAAANNLRKALGRLHRHAIKLSWRADNPVTATDPYPEGKGWHCWTEDEIAQYEARWPLGTRERLAMALLLHTALRRSDMVTIGRQHRKDGELHLRHGKNSSDTIIPIAPDLAAALDAMDDTHMTYLVTEFGAPFTGNGFGNWFRDRCDKAGLPQCSAHGLRKAMSRRLAESGATMLEGRSVTGHKTDREFAHYAEQASKRTLAKAAIGKVVANRSPE
ncbi:MAG: tyrosine-type recombinase/integrase [Novosphingobium sp.]|nr:tyrosine-type recombinase/integrase [Novosphingobium sp.]